MGKTMKYKPWHPQKWFPENEEDEETLGCFYITLVLGVLIYLFIKHMVN